MIQKLASKALLLATVSFVITIVVSVIIVSDDMILSAKNQKVQFCSRFTEEKNSKTLAVKCFQ